jgi:hypothetical protein
MLEYCFVAKLLACTLDILHAERKCYPGIILQTWTTPGWKRSNANEVRFGGALIGAVLKGINI